MTAGDRLAMKSVDQIRSTSRAAHRPMGPRRLVRAVLMMLIAGLAAVGLLGDPQPAAVRAAPAAQAQPVPSPRTTPSPAPTRSPEQRLQDLQLRKLTAESQMAESQYERNEQLRDIDRQVWRAPAAAVAAFGPTIVGLGLLYLLARALARLLPPRQGEQRAAVDEAEYDEEDEEL